MKRLIAITVLIMMIVPLGITYAQGPPGMSGGMMEPPNDPDNPEPPSRERFHTMQMWKLTETLDLDEAQAVKFFPLFNEHQKRMDAIHDDNRELLQKLDGYIKADEAGKLEGIISQIEKNEEKMLAEKQNFRKDASKVLTEIQIGKLVHFHHDFPRKFREAMWGVRGARGDRGGKAPGPGGKGNRPYAPRMQNMNPQCPY